VPQAKENSALVLPPQDEWAIGQDDMLAYYEWAVSRAPQLVFVEISSVDDDIQVALFEMLGGRQRECCMDGCICSEGASGDKGNHGRVPPDYLATGGLWMPWQHATSWQGEQHHKDDPPASRYAPAPSTESMHTLLGLGLGGSLDWTKTRKIATIRKHRRLPHNYRSYLLPGNRRGFLAQNQAYRFACPSFVPGASNCHAEYILKEWIKGISIADLELDGLGMIVNSTLVDGHSYHERIFGRSTCKGCLDGILGSLSPVEELCNSTLPPGHNLLSIAPRFRTTWLALWSLNSGAAPDEAPEGRAFRFAHELHMAPGESLRDVAQRMGTSVEQLVAINHNRLTHIHNPERPGRGAVICVVPSFRDSKDRMGEHICKKDKEPR